MSTCDHSLVDRVFSDLAVRRRRTILDYQMEVEAGRASFDALVDVDRGNGSIATTDRTGLAGPYLEFARNRPAESEADVRARWL